MSPSPQAVVLLLALLCFVAAAVWTPPANVRINLTAAGLALLTLALLIGP